MAKQAFLALLDDLFEEDAGALTGAEKLSDLPLWDSMTALAFIALVDEHFELVVSGDALSRCQTVDDLIALVGDQVTA